MNERQKQLVRQALELLRDSLREMIDDPALRAQPKEWNEVYRDYTEVCELLA